MILLILLSMISGAQFDIPQDRCLRAISEFEFKKDSQLQLLISLGEKRSAGWDSSGFFLVKGDKDVDRFLNESAGTSGRYTSFKPKHSVRLHWNPGDTRSRNPFTREESQKIYKDVVTRSFSAYYEMQQRGEKIDDSVARECKAVRNFKIDGRELSEMSLEIMDKAQIQAKAQARADAKAKGETPPLSPSPRSPSPAETDSDK